jgi:chorismate mutase / prephenate dehydratase
LDVLAENIEDNKHNVTRFAVIGDKPVAASGRDRTSLLLQIPHKPGSLSDALQLFKQGKLNLTWIESFPLRGPESGYIFFIDCEGHMKDQKVKRVLDEMAQFAVRMEVLGSYPRSEPLE